jgi:hypothetical protein
MEATVEPGKVSKARCSAENGDDKKINLKK